MHEFLQLLIRRHRAEIDLTQEGLQQNSLRSMGQVSEIRRTISELLLADSVLKKITLSEKYPDHPPQVVIIGPTQSGKSSLVNMLLQRNVAEASAVAGFTVHCQGYMSSDTATNEEWAKTYFNGFEVRAQASLDRQVLDEFSLTALDDVAFFEDKLENFVMWDTPDFDSVDSYGYRVPVLRATALADLIVCVVSKEKYADKTVWDMLTLLTQLGIPVVLVMNKTPVEHREQLAESVHSKFTRMKSIPADRGLLGVFFIDEYSSGLDAAEGSKELDLIRHAIVDNLTRSDPSQMQSNVHDFMSVHWSDWTASVVDEHRLQLEWRRLVDEVAESLIQRYRTEYLESTRYKETFQLALAELLALLEVPGMAEPLSKLRSVVTWPMRKLIARASEVSADSQIARDDRSEERRLLEALGEHGISRLEVELSEQKGDSQWWDSVQVNLDADKSSLLNEYGRGLDNYQILLQVEIERAAQSLYKSLEKQPATLNGLRAARVTADAAAVVLAVKSGGLGAADLVIAPAMLSLTTMLTEGALGQYMQKVQNDLREYQEKEVEGMIRRKFRTRLYRLAGNDDVGVKISQARLQEARDELGLSSATGFEASTQNGKTKVSNV